jgi:carbamoylphosphate synthase small subunit
VDLIVGEMEFDTSKIGKIEDPRTGGYMLTAENEGYNSAKEDRLRKENELVHRVIHPLFDKTEEQLREHDSNILKEAEEQKKKDKRIGRVHYNRRDRRER